VYIIPVIAIKQETYEQLQSIKHNVNLTWAELINNLIQWHKEEKDYENE